MSNYGNSGRSGKKNGNKDDFRKRGKSSNGFSRGGSRGGQGSGRQGRPIQKFDPSQFIKKVEEQIASVAYVPKNTFNDFAIDDQIKTNIRDKGYLLPTPIQDQVIPLILEGKDIIGIAGTGTGKTASFLIPLIHNVLTKKTQKVLIIAPTRELAEQIHTELDFFKFLTGLSAALSIGGVNIDRQINHLKKNPAFVVGTPGRLRDLEENGHIIYSKFDTIVLDEVDTMVDMGFIKDIKLIISKLPKKRHSLFFSATIPQELKGVINSFLNNPVSINVKSRQSAENVNQEVIKVGNKNKIELLHDLLIKPEFKKTIIFVRTKRNADQLSRILRERGFEIATMHGDKTQAQRKKALELFKENQVKILLATDVVARGIDIDDVSLVINFDLPGTQEDYIHRIGRTGRANKIGQAITFID